MEKTDEECVAQAANLRDEAAGLLDQYGLLSGIGGYGPTHVIGSYALDLMTWRDIDIYVQLPDERDIPTFFRIGDTIANRFEAIRMVYSNMFIRTDQDFQSGLYWNIRLLHRGQTWKVDLWGYGEAEYSEKMDGFQELRRTLEPADRLAVLRIKDVVCHWEQYRMGVYSVHIYDAVANHGVATVDEFKDWLRLHVPEAALAS